MSEIENSKKPGQLGPSWAIATGMVLLSCALGLMVYVICSLKAGDIGRFSHRHTHNSLIDRASKPAEFWYSAVAFTGMSLMLAYFAIPILREGFRGIRGKPTAPPLVENRRTESWRRG